MGNNVDTCACNQAVFNCRCSTEAEKQGEQATMKASCGGFTGELVKLERKKTFRVFGTLSERTATFVYDLSIYDSEKQVTYTFESVELSDIKFSGCEVTFA